MACSAHSLFRSPKKRPQSAPLITLFSPRSRRRSFLCCQRAAAIPHASKLTRELRRRNRPRGGARREQGRAPVGAADDGAHGRELWATNGTAAGTGRAAL